MQVNSSDGLNFTPLAVTPITQTHDPINETKPSSDLFAPLFGMFSSKERYKREQETFSTRINTLLAQFHQAKKQLADFQFNRLDQIAHLKQEIAKSVDATARAALKLEEDSLEIALRVDPWGIIDFSSKLAHYKNLIKSFQQIAIEFKFHSHLYRDDFFPEYAQNFENPDQIIKDLVERQKLVIKELYTNFIDLLRNKEIFSKCSLTSIFNSWAEFQHHHQLLGIDIQEEERTLFAAFQDEWKNPEKYVKNRAFGIPNIGNSCYMSAPLQCLNALSQLKTKAVTQIINNRDITPAKKKFLNVIVKYLNEVQRLKNPPEEKNKSLGSWLLGFQSEHPSMDQLAREVRDALFQIGADGFRPANKTAQSDAAEFLECVFDVCAIKFESSIKKTALFNGVVQTKYSSPDSRAVLKAPLNDDPHPDLQEIINRIAQPEEIAGDFSIEVSPDTLIPAELHDSSNCTDHGTIEIRLRPHFQQQVYTNLPEVLAIKAERLARGGDELREILTQVKIPENGIIDISPLMQEPLQMGNATYKLVAFITHVGGDYRSGHYTATVLSEDGAWIHCDDSTVRVLWEKHARKEAEKAYLWLFSKC